ncbi:SCO family protein [Bacillus sp. SD088]|uniref:SCO family protein n=1 Tax=Bacillus sp. SD088 TaxID=2782012 RepID=UPI001A961C54|nr:SCO family protein [Bacillus sp. SD088]MBO0993230.1 SCO family protein [Bacillus sp. SD088]
MKRFLPMILCSLFIILLSACSSIPKEGQPIQDFTYTKQDGETFGLEDLKGKVWVADFVFTNCTTVCPPMSANKSQLQQMVKDKGLKDVHFVSFSVDPESDTPDVLKKFYEEGFNVDFSTWHSLTGYSQQEIEEFALENFNAHVKKPRNDDQVIHGVDFYLVNKKGEVIKDYPGNIDVPYDQVIKDIKAALKQ